MVCGADARIERRCHHDFVELPLHLQLVRHFRLGTEVLQAVGSGVQLVVFPGDDFSIFGQHVRQGGSEQR